MPSAGGPWSAGDSLNWATCGYGVDDQALQVTAVMVARPGTDGIFSVKDQVVIVTGASSGIGAMVAQGLSRAGAAIVATARRKDRLDELVSTLHNAVAVECDLAVDSDRAQLVDAALATYGRLNGLVNVAGIEIAAPAKSESVGDFREGLEVDLVAPFDLCKRCLPAFRSERGGSIINF